MATSDPSAPSFPAGARVLLKDLKNAKQHNGKTGIVKSSTLNAEGRLHVFVQGKDMALKTANLELEPRSVSSLSTKELLIVYKAKQTSDASDTAAGMDKTELQEKVTALATTEQENAQMIAEYLATAPPEEEEEEEKKPAASKLKKGKHHTNKQQHDADRFSQRSPDQLRQQAAAMRSMNPAQLRRMNPQFRNMSDAQILQAADQMEMMANNPEMMKMATEQFKNMSPEEVERQKRAMSGATTATGSKRKQKKNQQAGIQDMTPEQLQQQARMMQSMDNATLRRMDPHFASMTDTQIDQLKTQMQLMASNPSMMQEMKEHMKNMSPEEIRAMQRGEAPPPADLQANMMKNMSGKQIKDMLAMAKTNPDMLKQLTEGSGLSEDALSKMVESFDQMNEQQIESALKAMGTVQTVTAPFRNAYAKVNGWTGGYLKYSLLVGILLVGIQYFFGESAAVAKTATDEAETVLNAAAQSNAVPVEDTEF